MFQQAARTTTNRQPVNVPPTLLLQMQAKQLTGRLSSSMECGETRVEHVAAGLLPFLGTVVDVDFINSRSSTWQAHLELIPTVWPGSVMG